MRRALSGPRYFGNSPKGMSWDPWCSVLIAARGKDLTKSKMKIFKKLSGRTRAAPDVPQILISNCYTRRFKRSRFSRAFFSSRSLAHLTMMANRMKNETIKKIGFVTSSSSK